MSKSSEIDDKTLESIFTFYSFGNKIFIFGILWRFNTLPRHPTEGSECRKKTGIYVGQYFFALTSWKQFFFLYKVGTPAHPIWYADDCFTATLSHQGPKNEIDRRKNIGIHTELHNTLCTKTFLTPSLT